MVREGERSGENGKEELILKESTVFVQNYRRTS